MSMTKRFEVANFENWGKLVKTWATGVNKLEDGRPISDYARPDTVEKLKAQCVMADVGATVPPYVTDVKFVQAGIAALQTVDAPTIATLLFRLPPKQLIEESEAELLAGADYAIPAFYNRIFDRPGGPTVADKKKLHNERIGEYTMNVCM